MPDNASPRQMGKAVPKKRRGLKFLFLLLVLLAGGGVWASLEYMRSGEVFIPMPAEMSKFINDKLVPGGRLGPVRFGDYAANAAQPVPEVVQNVTPDRAALPPAPPPVSPDAALEPAETPANLAANAPTNTLTDELPEAAPGAPSDPRLPGHEETEAEPAATLANSSAPEASRPAGAAEPALPNSETVSQAAAQPPRLAAGEKVTPPDAGWSDGAVTAYEEIREAVPEPEPRRLPSRSDVAVFEAPEPEERGMGPDAGISLVVAFDASAESRAAALMPVNLSATPADAAHRPKIYNGEDAVVSLNFVGDLAAYLAASYWPAGTHPSARGKDISLASLKTINQRYGIDLHGFSAGAGAGTARDHSRDRETVLDYVFMPSMLQALTNLYLDRFVDALAAMETVTDAKGAARRLTRAQRVGMLEYYAAEASALSDAINAYAGAPDAAALVNAYTRSEQEAQSANARYLDAKQALEIAAEAGDQAGVQEAGRDVSRLEAAYRRSLERQRNAENAVRAMMTKGASGRLGGGNLVYAASWLNRRVAADDTLRAAAASARFAAKVMTERAGALLAE